MDGNAPPGPVGSEDDLRRAIHPDLLDDRGQPVSGGFRGRDRSYDAASLSTLRETQARWPTSSIAVVPCLRFLNLNLHPRHDPIPENLSHCVVPGNTSRTKARKLCLQLSALHPPVPEGT